MIPPFISIANFAKLLNFLWPLFAFKSIYNRMKVAIIVTLICQPHTREELMPISLQSFTGTSWNVLFLLFKEEMKPTSAMEKFLAHFLLKFNFAKIPTIGYDH